MKNAVTLIEKASQFAAALDLCDYAAAAEYLAGNCRYYFSGDDVREGPAAILASYAESDANARRKFDEVRYSSEASLDSSGGVQLVFIDELRVGDSSHTYRCSQIAHFDDQGRICRIALMQFPEEQRRLGDFCRRHGISLV